MPPSRLPENPVSHMNMDHREQVGMPFPPQARKSHHFHSAALDDKMSPLQVARQRWNPTLPLKLRGAIKGASNTNEHAGNPEFNKTASAEDMAELSKLFPHIWQTPYTNICACSAPGEFGDAPPIRMAVVLSGGQAPGGHNVISGVYDNIKRSNPNSQLFGFVGGPHGIFSQEYVEINDEFMDRFRNQGGFDMIRSGRHKIETEEQKQMSMQICKKLDLHGLVVIGGDDSNTNAAIVAEYFEANGCKTKVVGCPKTIDGDLRNEYVQASFGFDTAVKTYAEFVGNLCTDVATSGKYYHFVRLMGRSASHITLECAMQTRPNMTFIGEEIQAKKQTLRDIVNEVVDMILKRKEMNRNYGVVLLPEGLIEFIPEMGELISEINDIMAKDTSLIGATQEVLAEGIKRQLSIGCQKVFDFLPKSIQNQLLLDRDPHGNVQVAMIATEKLLILSVERELSHRGFDPTKMFFPQAHYFGYEGRCGMPSNFDSNYCYALGHVAASLVSCRINGCMAVLRNLEKPVEEWEPAGVPLTLMMNMERRKGKQVPVIKKFLVELDSLLFTTFSKVRDEWKYRDVYRSPGPIQFDGPTSEDANYTVKLPTVEELLPAIPSNLAELKGRHYFAKSKAQMSELERLRLNSKVLVNPILQDSSAGISNTAKLICKDQDILRSITRSYPLQIQLSRHCQYDIGINVNESDRQDMMLMAASLLRSQSQNGVYVQQNNGSIESPTFNTVFEKKGHNLKVGVVLTGQQAPGVANVLVGIYERINNNGGKVIGFNGVEGLLNNKYIEITQNDIELQKNQGGFTLLGRTAEDEPLVGTKEGIEKIKTTCIKHDLDGLIMIGGCWTLTDCAMLSEAFLFHGIKTRIVGVPASQNNNIGTNFIETSIGFDSASKCYSQLIGNLLTDAASATKYWYFVRLMGRDKSQMVLEASLQTHSNITLVSEVLAAGDKTLQDVVSDIADIISTRADEGKNFGTMLIPEGLITELPQMRQLLNELNNILSTEEAIKHTQKIKDELVYFTVDTAIYKKQLTSWSWQLLKTLPLFIREQMIQPRTLGRFQLSKIASEEMLSQMVAEELKKRKTNGLYKGTFSPVCFYFGYQARSAMPSIFDCSLGLSHGYLSAICVETGLTGYATSLRGLCGHPQTWRPILFPIFAMLRMPPPNEKYAMKVPMVLPDMISLKSKSLQKVESASDMWEMEDRFCNPGPVQFYGDASHYYTRFLFEEHFDYMYNLKEVASNLSMLQDLCCFGMDELSLSTVRTSLQMLITLLQSQESTEARGNFRASLASLSSKYKCFPIMTPRSSFSASGADNHDNILGINQKENNPKYLSAQQWAGQVEIPFNL